MTSRIGAALDGDGLGELHAVASEGDAHMRVRFVPGELAPWTERARKVSVLGHPNVVSVLGIGAIQGCTFLVEDHPEDERLRRLIARAPEAHLSLTDVARLLGSVLAALRHAHDINLAHGALTAAVSVARDGVGDFDVRVSGFGLLPTLREHHASFIPELWETLAPELADGTASPNATTDAYAFGVLLVECLTGSIHPRGARHPWRELAATPELLRKRLSEAREGVPKSLWNLVAGLLAETPDARAPKTARELARALQR